MPRILSIDYGQKRTGIAVTDEFQIIASGLTTIPSATTIDFLKDYFSKEKVESVLIGEPKQMNGEPSESADDHRWKRLGIAWVRPHAADRNWLG